MSDKETAPKEHAMVKVPVYLSGVNFFSRMRIRHAWCVSHKESNAYITFKVGMKHYKCMENLKDFL